MKVFSYILMIFAIASTAYANDNIIVLRHFSIAIPEGMAIDFQSNDKIAFIFNGGEDLEDGTLSVSTKESDHLLDFSTAWSRIRTATVSGKKVLYEEDKTFGGLNWEVIAVEGTNDQCKIKDVLYYSTEMNVQYMLHYHCNSENCDVLKRAIDTIIVSFKMESRTE